SRHRRPLRARPRRRRQNRARAGRPALRRPGLYLPRSRGASVVDRPDPGRDDRRRNGRRHRPQDRRKPLRSERMATKTTGFQPSVIYQDPKAAMKWLAEAFGFEPAIYIEGDDGRFLHCQMSYGEALISIGQEWDEAFKSPLKLNGKNTQLTS